MYFSFQIKRAPVSHVDYMLRLVFASSLSFISMDISMLPSHCVDRAGRCCDIHASAKHPIEPGTVLMHTFV